MLASWMSLGVNSLLRRFTAKTSTQRVYDVRFPRRVKNEKQNGGERQTVQALLRILSEAIGRRESAVFRNHLLAFTFAPLSAPSQ
jgi:hypothetical protein